MKFYRLRGMRCEKFRRLTGITRDLFDKCTVILKEADTVKRKRGGQPHKLSIENILLMTLEYIREYRTYFHISKSYGVSESTAYKCIKWVEDTLIKHPEFALPGRKALLASDVEYEVVVIDATECPIERPKKSSANTIQARKNATPRRLR
jgi:hypothetical protein